MSRQLQPGDPVTVNMPTNRAFQLGDLEIMEVAPRRGLVLGVAVLVLNERGAGGDVHIIKPHEVNRL